MRPQTHDGRGEFPNMTREDKEIGMIIYLFWVAGTALSHETVEHSAWLVLVKQK